MHKKCIHDIAEIVWASERVREWESVESERERQWQQEFGEQKSVQDILNELALYRGLGAGSKFVQ